MNIDMYDIFFQFPEMEVTCIYVYAKTAGFLA